MQVELIFDKGCPNVQDARAQLQRAFSEIGRPPQWREWDCGDPASPAYAGAYGSPTILVDRKDVAGALPTDGADCCRLYRTSAGRLAGVPGVEQIVEALRAAGGAANAPSKGARKNAVRRSTISLAVVPAVAVALLPSITCPACWPAYAALLSSLGIGFLPTSVYLLPLTLGAVAFALLMFAWQARRRRRFGPLILATMGALVLLVGRFALQAEGGLYCGVGMLVAASLWDAWPVRRQAASAQLPNKESCPACQSTASTKESAQHNPLDSGLGSGA
jgi:hypothetical protein